MAAQDLTFGQFNPGGAAQTADIVPIERGGLNYRITISAIAAFVNANLSAVKSLSNGTDTLSGAVQLIAGANMTIAKTAANTFTFSSTGGGGGVSLPSKTLLANTTSSTGSGAGVTLAEAMNALQPTGTRWYVDSVNGNDSNRGNTEMNPFATATKAHSVAANGDAIYFNPQFSMSGNFAITKNLIFNAQGNCRWNGGVTDSSQSSVWRGNHSFNSTNRPGLNFPNGGAHHLEIVNYDITYDSPIDIACALKNTSGASVFIGSIGYASLATTWDSSTQSSITRCCHFWTSGSAAFTLNVSDAIIYIKRSNNLVKYNVYYSDATNNSSLATFNGIQISDFNTGQSDTTINDLFEGAPGFTHQILATNLSWTSQGTRTAGPKIRFANADGGMSRSAITVNDVTVQPGNLIQGDLLLSNANGTSDFCSVTDLTLLGNMTLATSGNGRNFYDYANITGIKYASYFSSSFIDPPIGQPTITGDTTLNEVSKYLVLQPDGTGYKIFLPTLAYLSTVMAIGEEFYILNLDLSGNNYSIDICYNDGTALATLDSLAGASFLLVNTTENAGIQVIPKMLFPISDNGPTTGVQKIPVSGIKEEQYANQHMLSSDGLDYFLQNPPQGTMLVKGTNGWQRLNQGSTGQFFQSKGANAIPEFVSVSNALDEIASDVGSMLVRTSNGWEAIDPGTANQFLQSQGPGNLPKYVSAAIPSATIQPFSPVDTSGAGIALANPSANYIVIGKMVLITMFFEYPDQSNTLTAKVGHLPLPFNSSMPPQIGICKIVSTSIAANSSFLFQGIPGQNAGNIIINNIAVKNQTLALSIISVTMMYMTD